MGNNPTQGIQYLPVIVTDNTSLQSLNSLDSVSSINTLASQAESFLLKRWRFMGVVDLVSSNFFVLFYLNVPSATSAETELGIETTPGDPADFSQWDEHVATKAVIWSSLFPVFGTDQVVTQIADQSIRFDSGWLQVGAKGKGIPYGEGVGPEVHAYNPSGNIFQADLNMDGLVIFEGVYLRG